MLTVIENYNLEDIKRSIRYLLEKSAHSESVRQKALDITRVSPDPVQAIYDWVQKNVRYEPDPTDAELFISPVRMVDDFDAYKPLAGDCDDMALLTVALLRSIDYQANVVLLDTRGRGLDHATAFVRLPTGTEVYVDTSTKKYPLGWEEADFGRIVVD